MAGACFGRSTGVLTSAVFTAMGQRSLATIQNATRTRPAVCSYFWGAGGQDDSRYCALLWSKSLTPTRVRQVIFPTLELLLQYVGTLLCRVLNRHSDSGNAVPIKKKYRQKRVGPGTSTAEAPIYTMFRVVVGITRDEVCLLARCCPEIPNLARLSRHCGGWRRSCTLRVAEAYANIL